MAVDAGGHVGVAVHERRAVNARAVARLDLAVAAGARPWDAEAPLRQERAVLSGDLLLRVRVMAVRADGGVLVAPRDRLDVNAVQLPLELVVVALLAGRIVADRVVARRAGLHHRMRVSRVLGVAVGAAGAHRAVDRRGPGLGVDRDVLGGTVGERDGGARLPVAVEALLGGGGPAHEEGGRPEEEESGEAGTFHR
jgi:hypothetical protein